MSCRREVSLVVVCLTLVAAILASPLSEMARAQQPLPYVWTRCGGPFGGLGYDVRMHPDHPDTMFVTDSFAGPFRSFNGGQTWHPVHNGITIFGGYSGDAIKAFSLTIDPVNPSTIWLGLQDIGGIYKSTDLGENWEPKLNGLGDLTGYSFRGFTIDPDHPDTVYAAGEINSLRWNGEVLQGLEFDKTMGMVFKTEDGGDHWYEIWRGDNLARYIWIDPRDTQTLYVSTGIFDREAADSDTSTYYPGGVGILKSTDGGATWVQKNNGLDGLYVGTLFMHPKNPDILLAGADSGRYGGGGVYLTINGGDLWELVLPDVAQSVEFSVEDSLVAYAGNATSVYRSDDGGWNWAQVTTDIGVWGPPGTEAGFPIDFQVDPRDAYRIFTNNYGGGNFLSTDGGHMWSIASKGYTGAHVRDLAVSGDDPARVYAAARTGIFRSLNYGQNWEGRIYAPASGVEWNVVSINPLDSYHILAANNWTKTIYSSHDGAETWEGEGLILPETKAWRCFEFAPSDTSTIYAGSAASLSAGQFANDYPGMGIFKSTNGGNSWFDANDSTSSDANVAELAVNGENSHVVYAACTNKGVLKTINGGGDWSLENTGLPANQGALAVAIDPADSNHIFVGLDDAGLYESLDGGSSWTSVAVGLPAEADVMDIVYCPVNEKLVYIADQRSGVYRSTNGGWTWIGVSDSLLPTAVNALAFSADGSTLYAGTEGGGVFRLDGAGAVAGVEYLPPRTGGGYLQQNRPNPFQSTTAIIYYAMKGKRVRLAVFDAAGRLVRVLVDEKAAVTGRQEAVWDGSLSDGGRAAAGVYFYRLEIEGRVETKRMVLAK
jgi:photosystem II stability/assembly factor-like uncharacterized protein